MYTPCCSSGAPFPGRRASDSHPVLCYHREQEKSVFPERWFAKVSEFLSSRGYFVLIAALNFIFFFKSSFCSDFILNYFLVSGTAPEEPVVSKYGHTYERRLIEKYLETNGNKCPVTNEPLSREDLIVVKGNFFARYFSVILRIFHFYGSPKKKIKKNSIWSNKVYSNQFYSGQSGKATPS